MFKTAIDRRDVKQCRPAGSSADPPRRNDASQTKLNPDAVRASRRERPGIEEDPERWDGLS